MEHKELEQPQDAEVLQMPSERLGRALVLVGKTLLVLHICIFCLYVIPKFVYEVCSLTHAIGLTVILELQYYFLMFLILSAPASIFWLLIIQGKILLGTSKAYWLRNELAWYGVISLGLLFLMNSINAFFRNL